MGFLMKTILERIEIEQEAYPLKIKRNQLLSLIRFVGAYWGEPTDSLEEYAIEVAADWHHDLDAAIACFQSLKEQAIQDKYLNSKFIKQSDSLCTQQPEMIPDWETRQRLNRERKSK